MKSKEQFISAMEVVDSHFRDISQLMAAVDHVLIRDQFQAIGDASVFWDVSSVFDRGGRWLPNFAARAYTKGKKPDKAVGFCVHFGPYDEPSPAAYLKKSKLTLPFISIACLRDMKPGPLEIDRRQIWDRIWDSGWCAESEDRVEGSLRVYRTTKDISGFQAVIVGCLIDLAPDFYIETVTGQLAEALTMLHEGQDATLAAVDYLWPQKL